MIFCYQII
ncbi:hypothetical protein AYI70_g10743, partial [Smittium culicis]